MNLPGKTKRPNVKSKPLLKGGLKTLIVSDCNKKKIECDNDNS